MNEHRKNNRLLVDFVLGELSQDKASAVQTHLAGCSECRHEIKRLEALLECTDWISKSSADERTCQSAKQAILDAVDSKKIKQQTSGTNVNLEFIKKRIIKSPIIKIASAAVIIIAAILILQNDSVNVTSTAFGIDDVITALKKAQWMHVKYEVTKLSDSIAPEDIVRLPETWISVNPHRVVQIFGNGNISLSEDVSGVETAYDLKSNKITITYYSKVSDVQPFSIESLLFDQISDIEKRGGIVTYSNDLLQDKSVTVINIDTTNVSESGLSLSLFVDPQTHLPIKFTLRDVDGQSVIASGIIDYPEKGPVDIYELGAPQDAEVVVIDKRDQPELIEALKPYNKARGNLVSDYILISTYGRDSLIQTINVIYNQGRKQRSEYYSIWKPDDSMDDLKAHQKVVGDGFESMLKWSLNSENSKGKNLVVRIYDGAYYYRAEKDTLDKWEIEDKKYRPDHNPIALEDLSDWGWPSIPPKNCVKQIENDYSRENNLIAFEVTTGSDIRNGIIYVTAQKTINYLGPSRDYMCVRREMFYHPLSAGLGDTKIKDVDFDPNEIPAEPSFVRLVLEFGQTENGQWYPKKIETHSKSWDGDGKEKPLSLSSINTLYLRTNPVFPEGIFDPNNLPKQKD